jgi:hypothetical protein
MVDEQQCVSPQAQYVPEREMRMLKQVQIPSSACGYDYEYTGKSN